MLDDAGDLGLMNLSEAEGCGSIRRIYFQSPALVAILARAHLGGMQLAHRNMVSPIK